MDLSLNSGARLGPYEILSPLGAGGMGEVYRARDPRLGRDVAVKVLPASFSLDAERMRRFELEARAAGLLNHPNVTAVHDVGQHDGSPYVVSELLEGETLRQAIAGGKVPVRRAVDWAIQMAHGLAAAHEKGIVHRDLKPDNLFVTKDGRLKILDFGLAKVAGESADGSGSRVQTAAGATEPGTVLGTMGYMAPEQLRGRAADVRSDLFAFGAVLYEMLAGKKAFSGDSGADVISSILREEPADLSLSNQSVPPGLERIVRRCLEKAPERRFQSAGDLAFALESLTSESGVRPAARSGAPGVASPRVARRRAVFLGAAALLVIAGFLGGRLGRTPPAAPALLFDRLTSEPGIERSPALSPDGESVAYVRTIAGRAHILVQRVGSDKPIDLSADSPDSDTEPVYSPDGSRIAFRSARDGGGLFVMGPLGESVRRVTDAGYGPDFTPDGKEIVFAEEAPLTPFSRGSRSRLWAVEVATGKKRVIFGPDAVEPSVSPHGLRVAYWGLPGESAQRDIYTVPLAGLREGEKPVPVTNDAAVDFSPFWSADGAHLYFGSDRGGSLNLWRVPVDEASGRVKGPFEPVTLPVTWAGMFPGSFRGSRGGRRIAFTAPSELMTIERLALEAGTLRAVGPPVVLRRSSTVFEDLEISPDGATLATRTAGRTEDLCLISSDGLKLRRLTQDAFRNRAPAFTGDGKRVVFYSNRDRGSYRGYSMAVDGSGLQPVTAEGAPFYLYPAVSPDGRFLAASSMDTRITVYPLSAGPGGAPVAGGPAADFPARWPWAWSPDSRRLLAAGPGDEEVLSALLCSPEKKSCESLGVRASWGSFTPDGRTAVLSGPDGFRAVDLATRASRLIHAIPDSSVRKAVLSPDGRFLYFLRDVTEGDVWVGTFQ